jgi:predicted DCC family thiol-disulfide oxidoreductase YuxK
MPEQLKLLYDGQCSICRRATERLKRRDQENRIVAEDISDPAFDPGRYGLTAEQVRAVMYVLLPDGQVLAAMDAVRAAYTAVGRGWLLAPTGWPGIRWLADAFYAFFARHRLKFSRILGRKCDSAGCTIHPQR